MALRRSNHRSLIHLISTDYELSPHFRKAVGAFSYVAIRHRRFCSARSGKHLLGILPISPVWSLRLRKPRYSSAAAGLFASFPAFQKSLFRVPKIKQKNPQPEKWAVDKVVDKVVHRCCRCAVDNRECVSRRYPQGLWIFTGSADARLLPKYDLLLSLCADPSVNHWYERCTRKNKLCTNQLCARDFSLGLTPTRRMLCAP
jgi:hypothetical protein